MTNLKGSIISEEKRREVIDDIILFFKNERDEEIGVIAAESLLDFFIEEIGTDLYNKGVEDASNLVRTRFEDMEIDLESMKEKD